MAELSLFEQLAQQLLDARKRNDIETVSTLEQFVRDNADSMEHDWRLHGRPSQFAPPGTWRVWLVCAGRGFGKTRTGAEWVREKALQNPGCRIALVGRTSTDVSRTMIAGESGILSVHAPDEKPIYWRSKGQLEWPNGSIAEFFSSEAPSQLRGPQFHYAWGDEHAAWLHTVDDSGLNAWNNLDFATRLGSHPQILATTTPKRTQAILDLFDEHQENPEKVVITRGSTYDNIANLPESFVESVTGRYENTNIAKQELLGLLLGPDESALWTPEVIDRARWNGDESPWRRLPIRCVAVDPSVADEPKDEAGIIVVGATGQRELHKRHAYILEDATVHGAPPVWAQRAVDMARKYRCPIVAEGTQGQALVTNMIHSIDPKVEVFLVQTGRRGKIARAEPVILPYEQRRVHHVGTFDALELQLTTYSAENSKKSPDRLDALVHGVTACLIKPPENFGVGALKISQVSKGRRIMPTGRGTGRTWRSGTGQ